MERAEPVRERPGRGEKTASVLLVLAVLTIAAWEVLAWRSSRPLDAMPVDERLAAFEPRLTDWHAELIELPPDPQQINIVSCMLRRRYATGNVARRPVQTRLVHGYNMRDCMRIKGYEVELLDDTRDGPAFPVQTWLLTAKGGQRSLWVTTMIASGTLDATDMDVRAIPFPRVGTPDEFGWSAHGLSWKSLRHPVRSLRIFLRSRWNAARCDLVTFLRLRRPSWVSDELLTLVSHVGLAASDTAALGAPVRHVTSAHQAFHEALRSSTGPGATEGRAP